MPVPELDARRILDVYASMQEAGEALRHAGIPSLEASHMEHDNRRATWAIRHALQRDDLRPTGAVEGIEVQCTTLPGLCCGPCNKRPPSAYPDGSCHCPGCLHLAGVPDNGSYGID